MNVCTRLLHPLKGKALDEKMRKVEAGFRVYWTKAELFSKPHIWPRVENGVVNKADMMPTYEFFLSFGASMRDGQPFAVKITAQLSAATIAERDFKLYKGIATKKRSALGREKNDGTVTAIRIANIHANLHLEEFADFGIGTNELLEKVRLHTDGILAHKDLQSFYADVKLANGGNMSALGQMDVGRADCELYDLLHKEITVNLNAASVMTCASGHGFELYRMINKKLDPNNDVRRHTILVGRLSYCIHEVQGPGRHASRSGAAREFVLRVHQQDRGGRGRAREDVRHLAIHGRRHEDEGGSGRG